MIVGGVTVITWITSGLSGYLYEMIPGFLLSLISIVIVNLLIYKHNDIIDKEFDKMQKTLLDMN